MKIILVNESSISKELRNYVAVRRIFIGNVCKQYVFKKTLTKKEKEFPLDTIKSYHGSSRGKDVPSQEMLDDMMISDRQEIEILHQNSLKNKLGFFEQFEITSRRMKGIELYNKNNGIGSPSEGYVTKEQMMSYIQTKDLKEELSGDNDFKEGFKDRERIQTLKQNDCFIQGRSKVRNKKSVSRYKEQMKKDPNPKNWKGRLIEYLPENENDFEIIGDGNQSSDACLAVPKMPGLYSTQIPWPKHRYIRPEDKQSLGSWFNKQPTDSGDWADEEDIKRNIHTTLVEKKLFGKNNAPLLNSEFIDEIFDGHIFSPDDIKRIKNEIKKDFKDEVRSKEKALDNSYDFSEEALNPNSKHFLQDDKNAWDRIEKEIKEKFPNIDFVKKVKNNLIDEKTIKFSREYKKEKGYFPKTMLLLVWFEWAKKYIEYKKNDEWKNDMKDLVDFCSGHTSITIVLVNPEKNTDEKFIILNEIN